VMSKKTIALVLCMVLALTLGLGNTLAYLTDSDADVNVMTLGNVDIEQVELERIEQSDEKTGTDNLQQFTQGKPLFPAVGENQWATDYQQWPTGGSNQLHQDELKNVVDKFVFVENTGKSDAYVRSIFAFEAGTLAQADWHEMMHLNINGTYWKWNPEDIGSSDDMLVTIDGNNYYLVEAVYLGNAGANGDEHKGGVLPADETTRPSLLQVWLDHAATNETMEALDGNGNGTYDILVVSQAVQATGFTDAQTALDEAFGEITVDNNPWKQNGEDLEGTPDIPTIISTENEAEAVWSVENDEYTLKQSIVAQDISPWIEHESENGYTINGDGKTISIAASDEQTFNWDSTMTIPQLALVFSTENGAPVTVNDLTIEGTMQSVMAGNYESSNQGRHNTTFNNVNIVNTKVVSLSANISPALSVYGTLEMNDCNVYGTTLSPLDTDPMWPVYDMAVVNESKTTVNGGKIGSIIVWGKANIKLNNAQVDSITPIGNMNTNSNYGIYINQGTTVNVIDLSNITNKAKVNITIETGATVKKIVANGQEFTSLEAWKNAE